MKRQGIVLSAIALIAVAGMFLIENTASAHREGRNDRNRRENRSDNTRIRRARAAQMLNPVTLLNHSWTDLAFGVEVDAETLAKVYPIYQETREALQKQVKMARQPAANKATAEKSAEKATEKPTEKPNMDSAEKVMEKPKADAAEKPAVKAKGRQAKMQKMREGIKETYTKFHARLKEVLTEEQMTELTALTKKRHAAMEKRIEQARRSNREERSDRGRRANRRRG